MDFLGLSIKWYVQLPANIILSSLPSIIFLEQVDEGLSVEREIPGPGVTFPVSLR